MLTNILRAFAVLAVSLAIVSCSPNSGMDEYDREYKEQLAAYDKEKAATTKPLVIFPQAAAIRVFYNPPMFDNDPRPRLRTDNGINDAFFKAQPGGVLTAEEVKLLRSSLKDIPTPPSTPACCVPEHIFIFYDAAGARLGALEVCFQCLCAIKYQGADLVRAPSNGREIEWDKKNFAKIVAAHKLPLPKEPG